MVAHLLRLKLLLLRNSLKRSPWQLVGIILGGLYALSLLVVLAGALFVFGADPALARTAVILAGSTAVVAWAVIPVASSGLDLTLDPARFTTYAVPVPQLLAGLAAGGLIGIPGAVTLLAVLAQAASWYRSPAALAAALVLSAVAVFTCLIAARVAVAAAVSLTGSRRFREFTGLLMIIPLVLLGPIIAGVADGIRAGAEFLPGLAEVLSWTPLGAVWAVPGDIAIGHYGAAAAKTLISAAFLALLVLAWKTLLLRALVRPPQAGAGRKAAGLGLLARFPATPTGAVAARSLIYWLRDPRYSASLLILPLLVVVLLFAGNNAGAEAGLMVPLALGPLVAFMLGFSISADVSYDSTAFALHLATGVSGRADRAGRALACAVLSVPAVLAAAVLPAALTGHADLIAPVLGVSLAALMIGLGVSSAVSARYTYNVPLPGENAFKTPPGSTGRALLVQGAFSLVTFALLVPVLVPGVLAVVLESTLWGVVTLLAGLLLGAAVLILGIRLGGRWLDARGPELLQQVSINK
ncbi:transporter [Arthrobacter sp. zg-Y859]|uniref:Transporter n=1 Tax=Arthrobacter jinronghuae TaxID=2964609 RepID=A0ABT1NPE0_9MICC|nr:transporter [Arthrobacter jinronghuae]MCQ1949608.1 transporter [Arthrobacter jinronghuae]UWX77626.1 transporter [Arthrobacter jinronghuae]